MEVSENTGTSNGIESDTPGFEITLLAITMASIISFKRRNKRN